jgi:hypothetical protein
MARIDARLTREIRESGAAEIPRRPGHAGGRYDADVSRWVLAYIIGREWEPYAVKAFDEANPGNASYAGRYLEAASAPASDRWMAEQCDHLLSYEVDRYNAIRPIAYTNWPTLDPLIHPTEATTEEESAWRVLHGKPGNLVREYENDVIGLDAMLIRPTSRNPAGWFASYHAYPYYPDFILLDPEYSRARSSEGPSNCPSVMLPSGRVATTYMGGLQAPNEDVENDTQFQLARDEGRDTFPYQVPALKNYQLRM